VHARSLSLFCGPRSSAQKPVRSPVPSLTHGVCLSDPSPPNCLCSAPWTRTGPRDFRPRPHVPEPFLDHTLVHSPSPAQLRPQPSTLALSLTLRVPREFHRRTPWSHARSAVVVEPSLCRCLDKLRLITRNPGCPSVHPLPLWFAWSMLTGAFLAQPKSRRHRPVSLLCPGRCSLAPESSLKVTVLTPPLISPALHLLTRDCSPEYSPVRRGLPHRRPVASPPFLLSRSRHSVRRVLPNLSSNPDRPLAP
jgi:hypothetical protein